MIDSTVMISSNLSGFDGDASDGSDLLPHLILEDLMSNLANPSVTDTKIGSKTWYPAAPEDYFLKCLKKDRETTSLKLGFRISGLQVHDGKESSPISGQDLRSKVEPPVLYRQLPRSFPKGSPLLYKEPQPLLQVEPMQSRN
ncbi:inositol polyphosphate multikinase [Asimina triloba]